MSKTRARPKTCDRVRVAVEVFANARQRKRATAPSFIEGRGVARSADSPRRLLPPWTHRAVSSLPARRRVPARSRRFGPSRTTRTARSSSRAATTAFCRCTAAQRPKPHPYTRPRAARAHRLFARGALLLFFFPLLGARSTGSAAAPRALLCVGKFDRTRAGCIEGALIQGGGSLGERVMKRAHKRKNISERAAAPQRNRAR